MRIKRFGIPVIIQYLNRLLLKINGINICYNSNIVKNYNPKLRNILLALESPGIIKYHDWIKPYMNFEVEISFERMTSAPIWINCYDLYLNLDAFADIDININYLKFKEVSIISSNKSLLYGHQLRTEIINKFEVDSFGLKDHSEDIDKAYKNYRFQIVVENYKSPYYVSEKFFTCIKSKTIPIYCGGEDGIREMGFDLNGVYFFNTIDELVGILKRPPTYNSDVADKNRVLLKQLRNESRCLLYFNTVIFNYFHNKNSYLKYKTNERAFKVE